MKVITQKAFDEITLYLKEKNNKFSPFLKYDTSENRSCHLGGAWHSYKNHGISMSEYCLKREIKLGLFLEYSSISNDNIIGSIVTDSEETIVYSSVAHELAHAYLAFTRNCDVHGPKWKTLYKELRLEFVNNKPLTKIGFPRNTSQGRLYVDLPNVPVGKVLEINEKKWQYVWSKSKNGTLIPVLRDCETLVLQNCNKDQLIYMAS